MKTINCNKIDISFLPKQLQNEIQQSIEEGMASVIKLGIPIESIVLGGGWKNKEIIYTDKKISSDLDLFIFSNWLPFYWRKIIKINQELDKHISPKIHYRGVIPFLLFKSKTFWAYKLKQEGIILKGNTKILKRIQATSNNINHIEAIRILFQTLVNWLLLFELKYPSRNAPITILRAYLNIGDAHLTFAGNLAPSYNNRFNNFKKIATTTSLEQEMINKIELGYQAKIRNDFPQYLGNKQLPNMQQAKQDCLKSINDLLSKHLGQKQSIDKQLDIISKSLKPHYIFNFIFYIFARNAHLSPKLIPFLMIKITDLYKMAFYYNTNQFEKYNYLLQKYFLGNKFDKTILVKIFELWPIPSTMEL